MITAVERDALVVDRAGLVSTSVMPARVETRFPPRAPTTGWPETRLDREQAVERLTGGPFALDSVGGRKRRRHGVAALLDWLGAQPGQTWQDRWLASGADTAGAGWRDMPAQWLRASGRTSRLDPLCAALTIAICADLVRPSIGWFVTSVPRGGALVRGMAQARDADGFARLRRQCGHDAHLPAAAGTHTLHRAAVILGAKGGVVAEVTVGDVVELLDVEIGCHRSLMGHATAFYRTLHQLGIFSADAPTRLQELRNTGQRTPAQLIDRFDWRVGRCATCWSSTCANAHRRWTTVLRSAAGVSVWYADCGVDLRECGFARAARVLLGGSVAPGQRPAGMISMTFLGRGKSSRA